MLRLDQVDAIGVVKQRATWSNLWLPETSVRTLFEHSSWCDETAWNFRQHDVESCHTRAQTLLPGPLFELLLVLYLIDLCTFKGQSFKLKSKHHLIDEAPLQRAAVSAATSGTTGGERFGFLHDRRRKRKFVATGPPPLPILGGSTLWSWDQMTID